jgi:hypothetical protein
MKNVLALSFDMIYPFFCGAVVSALVCFFTAFPWFMAKVEFASRSLGSGSAPESRALSGGSGLDSSASALTQAPVVLSSPALSLGEDAAGQKDSILTAYLDEGRQDGVIAFFATLIRSEVLAAAILSNAAAYNIAPSLAFALCWAESRFNPQAVNRGNRDASIDRGLFQLNSNSFPHLSDAEFFNPGINAQYGMAHLRWCLDTGGSVVAGLAMYNAGTGRVSAGSTPKKTLDYVSHILASQRKIEEAFAPHPVYPVETTEVVAEAVPEEPALPGKPRLALLTPIAGRP